MDYQLSRLNANEFEKLSQDIMQEHLGVRLQISPEGRDGGRDLFTDAKDIVIQCKHYKKTTKYKLLKNIEKELPKVKSLNPKKYLVICSTVLTNTDKEKIRDSLGGYIAHTDDIWGYHDIETFLRASHNYKIVEQHPKLWVGTTAVLKKTLEDVIYRGNLNLTKARIKEAIDKINVYADISENREAVEKGLNSNGSVIITGAPGVGKTTLAEFIFVKHVDKGWSPVVVSRNIKEAFDLFDDDKKQVFFWDDCWGDTFLHNKLDRNEDSQLIMFLGECAKANNNKRLILISRDYIYNQARDEYERLRRDVQIENVVVNLNNYTRLEKAQILYNHLCDKDIEYSKLKELVDDKFYNSIIDHPSYSPRVIGAMLENASDYSAKEYRAQFLKSLDNPLLVWSDSFEKKLSYNARILLFAVYLSVRSEYYFTSPTISDVRECFLKISHLCQGQPGDFKKAFAECNEALIHRVESERVDFYNPSIKDFLRNKLFEDRAEWFELLSKANLRSSEVLNLILGAEEAFWEYYTGLSENDLKTLTKRLLQVNDKRYEDRLATKAIFKTVQKKPFKHKDHALAEFVRVLIVQLMKTYDAKDSSNHYFILECLNMVNSSKFLENSYIERLVESLSEDGFACDPDDAFDFVLNIYDFDSKYGPFDSFENEYFQSSCKSYLEWSVESELEHLAGEEPHDISRNLEDLKSWLSDVEVLTPIAVSDCNDMINDFEETMDFEAFIPSFKKSSSSSSSNKANIKSVSGSGQQDIDSLFEGLLEGKKIEE